MRILITGSQGIIGNKLSSVLSLEHEIFGLDSSPSRRSWEFHADISKHSEADAILAQIRPEIIIHLAAASWPAAHWDYLLKGNVIGTHTIYDCARRNGVRRVVFASTNHVVGRSYEEHLVGNRGLITVRDVYAPDGEYAVTKIFGEQLARSYYDEHGLSSIILRIGSVMPDDMPKTRRERLQWLSHRDLVQAFRCALETSVDFGTYFISSKIQEPAFDIGPAYHDLGFKPVDEINTLS
jgi:nucleoside-diphosphate-sugar epimerase